MISQEQIQKNREKIRLKLEKERKRKETELKKKAEKKRLEKGKEEKKKEREDLAIRIAEKIKPTKIPDVQKIEFPDVKSIKGNNGKNGEKGDKGIDGKDGKDGNKGDKGDTIKGKDGIDGIDGINGKDGSNGVDGKNADEEKIVKEVLSKIPVQETHLKEIEKMQKKIDEMKDDLANTPKIRGLITLVAGSGISIDEDELELGRPIISVDANAGTVENISSQCDGSTTIFATTSNSGIMWLSLNGTMLIEGKEFVRDSATQITLTFAPDTGEELYLKYI